MDSYDEFVIAPEYQESPQQEQHHPGGKFTKRGTQEVASPPNTAFGSSNQQTRPRSPVTHEDHDQRSDDGIGKLRSNYRRSSIGMYFPCKINFPFTISTTNLTKTKQPSDDVSEAAEIPRQKLERVIDIYKGVIVEHTGQKTIRIDKYVEAYTELLELMQLLGKLLGIVTRDLEQKVTNLKEYLAGPNKDTFLYLDSAIKHEIDTNFIYKTAEEVVKCSTSKSATRNILRLHFAMQFMLLFFNKLQADRETKISTIVTDAYRASLYKYHNWFIQKAAAICFLALPSRKQLTVRLGYGRDEEALNQVLKVLSSLGDEIFKLSDEIFRRLLDMDKFK